MDVGRSVDDIDREDPSDPAAVAFVCVAVVSLVEEWVCWGGGRNRTGELFPAPTSHHPPLPPSFPFLLRRRALRAVAVRADVVVVPRVVAVR
jgi:hypothetical protein